jgi:hypothetical protein
MEYPEQKPSGNPELIEQHKRKQRMGDSELAKKPGQEVDEDTNAGGSPTGEGGTQP